MANTQSDVAVVTGATSVIGRAIALDCERHRTAIMTSLRCNAWAVRKHLVPALGKHRLAKLTPDHVEPRSLTPAEAHALLAAVRDDRLEALVVLGLAMGLRPGELTGLSWHDVDLAAGVVHMRQTMKRERNRPVVGGLKTERSRRSLACPPFVIDALKRRQAVQDLERAAAGPEWSAQWSTSELVFTTTNGTPIDASNLRRFFHRACKTAGIGRWTPYEMRHSAASLLSAEGVPLERVADTLGHDGTRMVREVYRHAVAPTVDAAADPMQRLFGGGSGGPGNTDGSPPGSPSPSEDAYNDE